MAPRTLTLGEIADQAGGTIRTGPFGSQLHDSDYSDAPDAIPVVMPQDLVDGRVSTDHIARVDESHAQRLSQHRLQVGDVVDGRRGDIGRRALVTPREAGWLCGTGCLRISLGSSILDPDYLFYYLGLPKVVEWIQNQAIGATLPNLNTSILRSVSVTFAGPERQRDAVSGLVAIDDLIVNSNRRAEVLEETARSLYREWFVKGDWPTDGIRMSATNVAVGDLATDRRDTVDPSSVDPSTPHVGLEHIPRRSLAMKEWGRAGDVQSTKLLFRRGEVLFGKIRPYFHKAAIAPVDGVCSTDAIVIDALEPRLRPLVTSIVSSDEFIAIAVQTSNGTKMPRANWEVLLRTEVVVPPQPVLDEFLDLVGAIHQQIATLALTVRSLRTLRDLLLPHLVNGTQWRSPSEKDPEPR